MFPAQVFPETAVADSSGRLTIGGCDVSDLVGEYGTPLYVFDEAMIRNRCREFLHEFRSRYPNTDVAYACKAYINPALARIFMEEGLGLDVVSGGEMALARSVGFPAASVCFHGNNKGRQELQDAVDWSIGTVALDSFHEIQLLDEIAGAAGVVQEVLVRVSPGIDAHTHVFTTTGILDSKFGFPIQTGQAEDAIHRVLRSSNLKLKGLHFHLGSPIFELEPYRKALELVLNFASKFREEGLDLREISPGGGFAIAYTKEQIPPTIAQYAEAIAGSLSDTCRSLGMDLPQLVVEPGRSITGPAGVALYRVGAVKDIPGVRKYISVDGGMGDNIRPALYEAVYEAVVVGKLNMEPSEMVTIAGKYCESGDVLVRDVHLPPVDADDIIAIPAAGAYCLSMASTYNMNPRPPIVLVKDGSAQLIRRRESYQDMMLCDVV